MSALFSTFKLKDTILRNRIAVPPMCQYRADQGHANDWHLAHYSALARGGAGLVVVEATAVSPEGRITPGCLGLWDDNQVEGLRKVAAAIKAQGAVPGIQIGHAGRKASVRRPWEGDDHIPVEDPSGWETLAPSALAFGESMWRVPREMNVQDIARVQKAFVDSARRAQEAGFEWLELHFAHGFLAQSFFSRHSNHREDAYGGSFENRSRFLVEALSMVRQVWPERWPLTARFGVIEYDGEDERTLVESISLAKRFRTEGLDLLHVSLNFVIPNTQVPWGTPAFLAPIARRVRQEAGLPVASSWCVDDARTAEGVIARRDMDVVMIGRAHLANPHYSYQLALELNVDRPAWVLPAPYAHWLSRYRGPGKAAAQ